MRNILRGVLVVLLVATGGCLFSADDGPPAAPESGWQPELFITPDSVSVWFPFDWPDTTTFRWNVYAEGIREYVMEAVVPVQSVTLVDVHLAFVRSSDGGAPGHGSFAEMAKDAEGYYWATDPTTGEVLGRAWPFNEIDVLPNGVLLRAFHVFAGWMYANPPRAESFWPVTFARHHLFDFKEVHRRADYHHDLAQERARRLDGPLDEDDYIVMDVVLKRYHAGDSAAVAVLSRTAVLPVAYFPFIEGDLIDRDMRVLNPDHDTHAAFSVVRLRELDTSSLSQLGYTMVEPGVPYAPAVLYVQLSAVGYNHARDQALVYGEYYCGNLCGAAEVFLLEKVHGYWVIKNTVELWIS